MLSRAERCMYVRVYIREDGGKTRSKGLTSLLLVNRERLPVLLLDLLQLLVNRQLLVLAQVLPLSLDVRERDHRLRRGSRRRRRSSRMHTASCRSQSARLQRSATRADGGKSGRRTRQTKSLHYDDDRITISGGREERRWESGGNMRYMEGERMSRESPLMNMGSGNEHD